MSNKKATIGRPAKKIKVELTEREEIELDNLAKREDDCGKKAKLLTQLASGEYTQPELMQTTNKSRQQILNFIARFKRYGMEAIKRKYIFNQKPARQVKLTENQKKDLLAIAPRPPKDLGYEFTDWTLKRLTEYLEKKYGVKVTRERIRQILADSNVKYFTKRKMPI